MTLSEHVNKAHGAALMEEKKQCLYCDAAFESFVELGNHSKQGHCHFFCDVCFVGFISEPLLMEHRVNDHPTGRPGEPGECLPSAPVVQTEGDPDIEVTKVVDPDLAKAMEVVRTPELDPFADKWHPVVGKVKQDGKNKVQCKECHRYLKSNRMRVEHVMQFHPWISYDYRFCPGLVLYTTRDLFIHCKNNHLICNLCNSALKDQKALQIHNKKHHKKPAAAKLVPQPTVQPSLQPGAQPPLTEADTPEGAEVPSPSGDNTTPAADTSGASEANIHPAHTGFRCGKCNVYYPTEASFKIHINVHKTIPCPFCLQKFLNTASRDKHIRDGHKDKINTRVSCGVADCPEKFPTEKELRMHLRHQHRVVFMWRCKETDCLDCFEDITGLLQHGASHGRESHVKDPSGRRQWFICSTCREMFDTLHQLMIHTGTHPENKYKCDECGWYFNFIHALAIHG